MKLPLSVASMAVLGMLVGLGQLRAELRVGAAIVDVTPKAFPVLVNGGMTSRTVDRVHTRLHARAVVVDDGAERLAIVVVDSCMIPRPLQDDAKKLASQRTKIKADRMLISATHTHTAPASMACLGTDADPTYVPYLREKLAEAIAAAEAELQPAQVGWGSVDAPEYTALRRWIRRPDRIGVDPFGNPTMRAQMHSGRVWDDVVGESGPEDPELSMIAFRGTDGKPIALLCNFSMHYFGDQALSSDYFGLFCNALEKQIAPTQKADDGSRFVAIMSHGCSGDIWRRDYKIAAEQRNDAIKIGEYADGLAEIAMNAYGKIEFESVDDIAMREARMELKYRTPNKQMLEWAQRIDEQTGDRLPKTQTEVYAREQLILHERQSTEIVVQALRIGGIAIATTPNETYALTGLKVKHQSPLQRTMVIELANGGDGYIPPPEQHLMGGYNTWAARSAGLEPLAEPKIVEAAVGLLEQVAKKARRLHVQPLGPLAKQTLALKPLAYWRLDEWEGPHARDASTNGNGAVYEPQMAYFLAGPASNRYTGDELNRSPHFVDARLRAQLAEVGDRYSVSMWIWNGLPLDARQTAGWFLSRGRDHSLTTTGDHVGVGGREFAGKLIFESHDAKGHSLTVGKATIERWKWHHVVLVRDGQNVRIYVDGADKPDLEVDAPQNALAGLDQWFFAGRCDRSSNWEGRIDEVAVFNRALPPDEVAKIMAK